MEREYKLNIEGTIKHESTNPITIEVTRGQKGSYGWGIKVAGTEQEAILAQLKGADTQLQQDFPQPEGG